MNMLLLLFCFIVFVSFVFIVLPKCSVMHVTVMPVSAYMALAFVFGFIPNKLMMMMMML